MVNRKRIQIASSVDPDLWEKIREISSDTKIPMARLLDMALEKFIKEYQPKKLI